MNSPLDLIIEEKLFFSTFTESKESASSFRLYSTDEGRNKRNSKKDENDRKTTLTHVNSQGQASQ